MPLGTPLRHRVALRSIARAPLRLQSRWNAYRNASAHAEAAALPLIIRGPLPFRSPASCIASLGAMRALEVLRNLETPEPAAQETKAIVQYCYERGALILSTGTFGNVIRLLTPLVITDDQFDEAIAASSGEELIRRRVCRSAAAFRLNVTSDRQDSADLQEVTVMNFLILDGPRDQRTSYNPLYRGTYRAHPTYCEALHDSLEFHKLFFWFLEEGGERGVVRDLSNAIRFVELCDTRLSGKECFAVIEVTDGDALLGSDSKFIGFDLSCGCNNSLLASGLKVSPGLSKLPEPVRELYSQISDRCAPQLNGQGLFQTSETASRCLRSMVGVQDVSPNFFAGADLRDFQPVALHAVSGLRG